mgnify:CR=1 FL=1
MRHLSLDLTVDFEKKVLTAEETLTERMTKGMPQANGEIAIEPRMDVKHVADAIIYMASLPLEANVQFLTVMATKMPFLGRG